MTVKKSWFSYCIWALYVVFACAFFVWTLLGVLEQTSIHNRYVQLGIVCLSLLLAAGVFALLRWLTGKRAPGAETKEKTVNRIAWEAFGAVLLFGTGLFLRIYFIGNGAEEAAYFETAGVNGTSLVPIAHGAQYLYVLLLRGLFFLTGNHFAAGVILQIVLQMAAAIVLYFAVRRFLGPTASLTVLAGLMLLPESIRMGLTYSPKMLYLFLYGIVLLMTGRFVKRKGQTMHWYAWVHTILLGMGIAFLSYLDVAGLTLLIPVAAICFYNPRKDREKEQKDAGTGRTLLLLFVVLISFFLSAGAFFLADALQSGVSIGRILQIWGALFGYKGIGVDAMLPGLWEGRTMLQYGLMAAMAFLLLLGVPAFFASRREEMQTPWFLLMVVTGVLWAGNFWAKGMSCDFLLLTCLLVLLGAGLQAALRKSETVLAAATVPKKGKQKPSEQAEEKQKPVVQEEEKAVEEPAQHSQIHYIENPLPLPKKHVKKTMGYKKELSPEEMKYDIEVSDDDDFDI